MATTKKTRSCKQQSLSLGKDTIEALEKEAERLGIPKSQLVDQMLLSQLAEDDDSPTVIAIMSYKGGVAKTTTTANLAVCLAEDGHKVLIIDLDGQGNVSQIFQAYDPRSEKACIADVLYQTSVGGKRYTLDEVMVETEYDNIWVAPSNFRFADADTRLKAEGAAGVDTRLRYAIEDMEETFDYIIIDCGPRLDMTTTNAIVALEAGNKNSHIIIPVKVDGFAIAGVSQTVDMINRTAKERRSQPQHWRILKTMTEPRTQVYKYGCEELKNALPNAIYFNTKISKSVVASESTLAMIPLVVYNPTCKLSLEYRVLAEEIEAMNE